MAYIDKLNGEIFFFFLFFFFFSQEEDLELLMDNRGREVEMDIFIHLLYFCQPHCYSWNVGKVY